jgi:hypothetical protein
MRSSGLLWVLLACVMLLVAHVASGHGHADLLATIPLQDHVPGDDHHESAGGSCDGVKGPPATTPTPTPTTASFIGPGVMSVERRAVGIDWAPDRPPLFLLHASLLI